MVLEEDMAHLEGHGSYSADRVDLIRATGNVSIAGEIIIYLRNVGTNLVVMNRHR